MATAILSSVSWLIQKLETPLQTFITPSSSCHPQRNIPEDVNKLKEMLLSVRAAVDQAEERQWRDERVRSWLMDLMDIACDAEDVLDELDFELLQFHSYSATRAQTSSTTWEEEVCNSVTSLACRIEKTRDRFHEILEQIEGLQLKGSERDDWLESRIWPRCDEVAKETEVFGREYDKEKVIELVLSQRLEPPPVMAIVGAAGVGKTTLVQLVYNDQRVREHFPRRGWVRMSKDFDVMTLRREVMESITLWDWRTQFSGKGHWIYSQPNYLDNCIKRELEAEKFFIVLDDFCDENLDLWETVNLQLSLGHAGSKIVLVTRSERVTSVIENMPLYNLNNLSEHNSWQLFQSLAFGSHPSSAEANLVKIGKEIVQKCKGLPLSIRMLGVLLKSETRAEIWSAILKSNLWNDDEGENGILPALGISFYFLPPHLQSCIAYCSVFPKDFLFKKDRLVRLWMAQGFVHPREGELLEETGYEYFDELLRRSFFLDSHTSDQTFVVHHLIHDLAENAVGKQCHKETNVKFSSISKETRHLSLITQDSLTDVNLELEYEPSSLRTILLVIKSVNSAFKSNQWYDYNGDILHLSFSDSTFQNLKCLRTLDLSDTDIKYLPDSIGNLKHLRFLGLNNTSIRWLPEQLCSLYNLQTLELQSCLLTELPRSIAYLTNLRHLDLLNSYDHIFLHRGIGRLINLQTLSMFYIGKDLEHYVIKELENLTNLRGELCVVGLHNVDDVADAKAAGLMHKEHLEKLTLQWCDPNDNCYHGDLELRSMNCHIGEDKYNATEVLSCGEVGEEDEGTPKLLSDKSIKQGQQCTEEASRKAISSCGEESEEMAGLQYCSDNKATLDDDMWIFKFDIDIDVADKPKGTIEELILRQRKVRESQALVLENLRPHGNLKELAIKHYRGSKLSSWIGDPAFSTLVSIRLDDCCNCEILPPLGQLPSLRYLLIRHFPSIKRVGREFCGRGTRDCKAFPSLETLEFDGMYKWEEWSGVEDGDFPCLRQLTFYCCMNFKSIPVRMTMFMQ